MYSRIESSSLFILLYMKKRERRAILSSFFLAFLENQFFFSSINFLDFPGIFMELADDIRQETALGGGHTVDHVGGKLFVWFGKVPG